MAAPVAQVFERNQDATCYVGNLDPKVDDELLWELMVREKSKFQSHFITNLNNLDRFTEIFVS